MVAVLGPASSLIGWLRGGEVGKGAGVVTLYNISVGIMRLFLALHNSGIIVWIIQVVKIQVIQSFVPS